MAASFLGKVNFNKLNSESQEFQPYHVILIDKEHSQIEGSKLRLESCLSEDPIEEVFMLKKGKFGQYQPPDYYGFPKSKC